MVRSFKSRVRDIFTTCFKKYENNFANKLYIIYTKEFIFNKFYRILAKEDNLLHLTGLVTSLRHLVFLFLLK